MTLSARGRGRGYFLISGPNGTEEGETMRCVHCGSTWRIKHGSGRKRGWCGGCGGPTCGGSACRECVPLMKKIEAAERRSALLSRA